MLVPEVKRLLSNLSDHGVLHLAEVETDLAQTNLLLYEAIAKLATSFMAINEAVQKQNQLVDQLLTCSVSAEEVRQVLREKQDEIRMHVGAAVTGLQFQDMTNQLIDRMRKRVNGLREVFRMANAEEAALVPGIDPTEITLLLNSYNNVLEEHSKKLETALWNAVAQTHMESGDIELF